MAKNNALFSKYWDRMREKSLSKPVSKEIVVKKPTYRDETDEEWKYRVFHLVFYCSRCGQPIYCEWEAVRHSPTTGNPVMWENRQRCLTCNDLTLVATVAMEYGDWSVRVKGDMRYEYPREKVQVEEKTSNSGV